MDRRFARKSTNFSISTESLFIFLVSLYSQGVQSAANGSRSYLSTVNNCHSCNNNSDSAHNLDSYDSCDC